MSETMTKTEKPKRKALRKEGGTLESQIAQALMAQYGPQIQKTLETDFGRRLVKIVQQAQWKWGFRNAKFGVSQDGTFDGRIRFFEEKKPDCLCEIEWKEDKEYVCWSATSRSAVTREGWIGVKIACFGDRIYAKEQVMLGFCAFMEVDWCVVDKT